MISDFALEERGEDEQPNGRYYLDQTQARKAALEVAKTHLHLSGKALDDYMNYNFMDTWNYYDTAHDGKIEADRMSTFFKYFAHNANLDLQ